MADHDQDSKTEAPSDKRLSEAHERGQFPKSPEINVVFVLAAALGALSLTLSTVAHDVAALATSVFTQLGSIKLQLDTVPVQLGQILVLIAKTLTPILGAATLAIVLAGGLQSGFNLTPNVLGFKPEALNPTSGFERIFSKKAFVHAGVDLLKIIAIGLVLWAAAKSLFSDPLFSAPVEAVYLGQFMERSTYAFLSRLLLALGVIAAISYWYEFIKSRKEMMMTREEVKEEHKQQEGNANSKAAMRRMARRLLQKQMLAAVPTADVIVTNPTHYAVALKYERGVDQAPVVLAKGENRFALRIKALAGEHGVPIVENKPVARMLFALGRVDEKIPSELYQAVAEILAFVYRTHRYYFYRLKSRRAELSRAATAPAHG
jgi:flagellar biosynthesis protein FlhB